LHNETSNKSPRPAACSAPEHRNGMVPEEKPQERRREKQRLEKREEGK